MAMRAPEASSEGVVMDVVLTAIRNAPVDDEPDTEAELEAMREFERTGEWYDGSTVSAEIAERVRREG